MATETEFLPKNMSAMRTACHEHVSACTVSMHSMQTSFGAAEQTIGALVGLHEGCEQLCATSAASVYDPCAQRS